MKNDKSNIFGLFSHIGWGIALLISSFFRLWEINAGSYFVIVIVGSFLIIIDAIFIFRVSPQDYTPKLEKEKKQ